MNTKFKPFPYQKKVIKRMLQQSFLNLFLDPGLGKTAIVLAAFRVLKEQGLVNRMLVIAPLRVCHNVWPNEVRKWSDFHGLTFKVLHGPRKNELVNAHTDITIINPEGIPWMLNARSAAQINLKQWSRWGFDMLVVDEISQYKNGNTQRFRLLKKLLPTFTRRYGLTGTPAARSLLDLWGQMYVVDRGRSLGPYFGHYRNTYFNPDLMGWTWTPKDPDEIHAKVKDFSVRMSAEDYLNLPKLMRHEVPVTLPPKVMKQYELMEEAFLAEVNGEFVTAGNAAAAGTKCRQMANGAVYTNDQKDWEEVHDAKIEAVRELVDELNGQPAIICYEYAHDLARLQEEFPDAKVIGGGTTTKKAEQAIEDWNAGRLRVLLIHPASAGHGLNLQAGGNHMIWFGLTWNLEHYDQTVRRIYRQGTTRNVSVYHVVAKDTLDEKVLRVLARKQRTQEALFNALK